MSKQRTALIVEDDENLAFIFSYALQAAGYQTAVVSEGRDAWRRLEETLPHMVVLDLHLPHLAGSEILKRIRSTEATKKMRVVIATADDRLAEQIGRQADVILIKPISVALLRELALRFGQELS